MTNSSTPHIMRGRSLVQVDIGPTWAAFLRENVTTSKLESRHRSTCSVAAMS